MRLRPFLALVLGVSISLPSYAQKNAPITDSQHPSLQHALDVQPVFQSTPLAYGYVYESGSIASGSGNFTASWNASSKWYAISIISISYYYSSYSTVVTTSVPYGNTNCQTDSVSGQLLVRCYTGSGAQTQADFGFIVF